VEQCKILTVSVTETDGRRAVCQPSEEVDEVQMREHTQHSGAIVSNCLLVYGVTCYPCKPTQRIILQCSAPGLTGKLAPLRNCAYDELHTLIYRKVMRDRRCLCPELIDVLCFF